MGKHKLKKKKSKKDSKKNKPKTSNNLFGSENSNCEGGRVIDISFVEFHNKIFTGF